MKEREYLVRKLRRGWELNFKTDLKAVGYEDWDWIHLLLIWVSDKLLGTR
jgi:hypothetical protein